MVSTADIKEAVTGLLQERFPGDKVYLNLVPKNFERPSALLECGPVQFDTASCDCLEVTVTLTLTLFSDIDEYHHSHIEELERRMAAAQELFAASYLEVGDRALHVEANSGESYYDYAEISITLHYQDDRPRAGEWPLMGEVKAKIKGGISGGIT